MLSGAMLRHDNNANKRPPQRYKDVQIFSQATYFISNIPTLSWQRYSGVWHSRDTLGLGTVGRLWGWALLDSWGWALQAGGWALGTPGRLCAWALQGDSGAGHSGKFWGWALQGDCGVGHSRETLGLGTQGISATRSRPGEEKSSGRGDKSSLKSKSPTPRVVKNFQRHLAKRSASTPPSSAPSAAEPSHSEGSELSLWDTGWHLES